MSAMSAGCVLGCPWFTKSPVPNGTCFNPCLNLAGLPYRAEAQFPDGITLWKLDSVDVDDPNHAVTEIFFKNSEVSE